MARSLSNMYYTDSITAQQSFDNFRNGVSDTRYYMQIG